MNMFTSTFIGVLVSNSIYTIFILIKRYIHLLMARFNNINMKFIFWYYNYINWHTCTLAISFIILVTFDSNWFDMFFCELFYSSISLIRFIFLSNFSTSFSIKFIVFKLLFKCRHYFFLNPRKHFLQRLFANGLIRSEK